MTKIGKGKYTRSFMKQLAKDSWSTCPNSREGTLARMLLDLLNAEAKTRRSNQRLVDSIV